MSGIRMREYDEDQNRIRSYLLGRLNEEERQRIEEKMFTDPAFFESIRMTEEELLEDYIFELLPPEDAQRFAQRLLLTPEQIERWEITTALKKYSDGAPKQDTQMQGTSVFYSHKANWGLTIAAVVTVAVVVGVWIIIRATSLERVVAALNTPGQTATMQSDFPLELPALRFRTEPEANTPEQRIAVPKQFEVVQIRLPVEVGSYPNYQTTLIREPDSTLFTLDDRFPIDSGNRKLLVVRVPADALAPGEYSLVVKGITNDGRVDDLGTYVFTIL